MPWIHSDKLRSHYYEGPPDLCARLEFCMKSNWPRLRNSDGQVERSHVQNEEMWRMAEELDQTSETIKIWRPI